MTPEQTTDLTNRFSHHPPPSTYVVEAHQMIRVACMAAAVTVTDMVPPGREQSLAITKLEEAMMWANAGIVRNS